MLNALRTRLFLIVLASVPIRELDIGLIHPSFLQSCRKALKLKMGGAAPQTLMTSHSEL